MFLVMSELPTVHSGLKIASKGNTEQLMECVVIILSRIRKA